MMIRVSLIGRDGKIVAEQWTDARSPNIFRLPILCGALENEAEFFGWHCWAEWRQVEPEPLSYWASIKERLIRQFGFKPEHIEMARIEPGE